MTWMITKVFDPDCVSEVATIGPRGGNPNIRASWPNVVPFRMRDDDNALVYEGITDHPHSFAPLHGFGLPNYGCTTIEYRSRGKSGKWEVL